MSREPALPGCSDLWPLWPWALCMEVKSFPRLTPALLSSCLHHHPSLFQEGSTPPCISPGPYPSTLSCLKFSSSFPHVQILHCPQGPDKMTPVLSHQAPTRNTFPFISKPSISSLLMVKERISSLRIGLIHFHVSWRGLGPINPD